MAAQEDIELVRKGYDAFIAGDMEWMNQHLHDNIVWHNPGHNVLSGDYKGRENVLAFFAKSMQVALPEFEIHDVLGSEDHVVAVLTVRWKRNDTGDSIEVRGAQVFHVDNQKAIEVWTLAEDQGEVDRFLEGAQA
jgi:ketosteroid isomerase-like protein